MKTLFFIAACLVLLVSCGPKSHAVVGPKYTASADLTKGKTIFENGEHNVPNLIKTITDKITEMPLADIDYVSVYEYPSLKTIETVKEKALAAVAVRFGKTRLIDNIILEK